MVAAVRMLAAVAAIWATAASAATPGDTFITLGTIGGPLPSATRSQPANLLVSPTQTILIDAGDGVSQRLAAAGSAPARVGTVLISHLHFDHTGGLAGLLGLRYAVSAPNLLTIYGPPGTSTMVAGLLASMQPAAAAGYGLPGQAVPKPDEKVRVVELKNGSVVAIGDITLTVAENSHYSFRPGSREHGAHKSLSFRLKTPFRTIVYTGDTGPSSSVEKLTRGADLLISEVIDLEQTVSSVRRANPALTDAAVASVARHLAEHHLSADAVATLATRTGVKKLILTHLLPGSSDASAVLKLQTDVAKGFKGPVVVAADLDRF